MENDSSFRNLVIILKMFNNRPYHLAKYLIENSALTDQFINKIKNNDKLKEFENEIGSNQSLVTSSMYFTDIEKMENFYNSIIDDIEKISKENPEEIRIKLNQKIDELIKQEKYEEAAKVRDYMIRNHIKRNL
jgi:hypothetical protein